MKKITISRVVRISSSMRGSTPFLTPSLTNATPQGDMLTSFIRCKASPGDTLNCVQPNGNGVYLKLFIA